MSPFFQVKSLGVILDSTLSFQSHINNFIYLFQPVFHKPPHSIPQSTQLLSSILAWSPPILTIVILFSMVFHKNPSINFKWFRSLLPVSSPKPPLSTTSLSYYNSYTGSP
ncbi:hypothetical protein AMECASPLE_013758 [Ameca splendens]|uniref:Uncharacterized protein n=1 Tax=Ameca splendens TaxID=208324 RepID=A0ABV0ZBK3_9TELE